MTIIILNDFAYVNGGASQVALSSAIALADRGYDVILFTAVGKFDSRLLNIENLRTVNLNQYDILNDPNRWRAIINGIWNKKAAHEFGKILDTLDRKDTIIHIHSYAKALSSSCIRTAIKMNFKVIFHMHDYGLACPNMGFFNYQRQEICTLEPLHCRCLKTNCDSRSYLHKIWRCLRQFVQIKFGLIPNEIDVCIAVSNFSYQLLKKHLPKQVNRFIVPNPINIHHEPRIKVQNNKNYIFIGRLSPEKNPLLLARAAEKLALPVVFIGSGPCEDAIKKACPHAVMTGWIDSDQIATYLREARCLVLTSAWYETQGMVVPEAAARGIPAIVPDTCAAQESIVINKSGLIFKNNKIGSLEETLMKMQDDDLVEKMGEIAYQSFWEQGKDMDAYIRNIVQIYQDVLRK